MDHKPLTYKFTKVNHNNETPRRTCQVLFVREFTSEIRSISGTNNIIADALSRVDAMSCHTTFDYLHIAAAQDKDSTIQSLLKQDNLQMEKATLPTANEQIYYDCSRLRIRPEALSHPGVRATRMVLKDRFFRPSMNVDVGKWAKACIACQRAKVQRHTQSVIFTFFTCPHRHSRTTPHVTASTTISYEW